MKMFVMNLFACWRNILSAWIFFFLLSLAGKSPYGLFLQVLISGAFSILITSSAIAYVKYIPIKKD